MDRQAVFDKVAKHLLVQNRQSKDGKACRYRAPNGDRCALGCLMDDADYDPAMEDGAPTPLPFGHKNNVLVTEFCLTKLKASLPDIRFLRELQLLHDEHDPSDWRSELLEFCGRYSLDSAVVE